MAVFRCFLTLSFYLDIIQDLLWLSRSPSIRPVRTPSLISSILTFPATVVSAESANKFPSSRLLHVWFSASYTVVDFADSAPSLSVEVVGESAPDFDKLALSITLASAGDRVISAFSNSTSAGAFSLSSEVIHTIHLFTATL